MRESKAGLVCINKTAIIWLLVWVGGLGGVGGAVNAALCFANLPVPVTEKGSILFQWHLIPAGALHGALLAVIAVGAARIAWRAPAWLRWGLVPIVGWIAGWVSWYPLGFSLKLLDGKWLKVLFWPIQGNPLEVATGLWQYFGLVSAVYYLLLNPCRRLPDKSLYAQLIVACVSGSLGSLWWWVTFKLGYFSLIHGIIWGLLVGFGVWKSQEQHSVT